MSVSQRGTCNSDIYAVTANQLWVYMWTAGKLEEACHHVLLNVAQLLSLLRVPAAANHTALITLMPAVL